MVMENQSNMMEHLSINGVNLEIKRISGDTDLPTLVLLHEGLGCIDMWRDFPEKLAKLTKYPVFVYSRQGYGRSDPCDVPRPIEYMHIEAKDVLPELLKVAKISNYILIGHSDGGSISLIFAGCEERPGLQALITMAPHIICEHITVDAIKLAKIAFNTGKLRQGLLKYHFENVDCAFWGWNGAWLNRYFKDWNIEEFLPNINVPQLIIQGEDDQYGTTIQVEGISEQSSGSVEIKMFKDCGHSPYREQTEICLDEIQLFLNQQK